MDDKMNCSLKERNYVSKEKERKWRREEKEVKRKAGLVSLVWVGRWFWVGRWGSGSPPFFKGKQMSIELWDRYLETNIEHSEDSAPVLVCYDD